MPKTADRPEVILLAGAEWERDPADAAILVSTGNSPARYREDTVRQFDRQRQAEAAQAQARRAAFEREQAAFDAAPRVEILGVTWVRADPRDPAALVSLDRTTTMRETTLRAIETTRANEAQQAQDREAAARSADRTSLEARLAELERQLAATS
jgi:hypothetical protein